MGTIEISADREAVHAPFAGPRPWVVGLIARAQFVRARAAIAGLADYRGYDDWLDARLGYQAGLAMAGVEAALAPVQLSSLLEWGRLTGRPASEHNLDAFAAMGSALRAAPGLWVLATLRVVDCDAHADALASLLGEGGLGGWLGRRQALWQGIEAAGESAVFVPVDFAAFLRWRARARQGLSAAALDRYARSVLRDLTAPAPLEIDFVGPHPIDWM